MESRNLRKTVSDISNEIERAGKDLEVLSKIDDEVVEANCRCCGQREDCTQDYIVHVTKDHGGTWVCGLCSVAIREYLSKNPEKGMEEAVDAHVQICENFNITTKINPKLTFTWAMKDIAKRSLQNRMLRRISSCIPRINPN